MLVVAHGRGFRRLLSFRAFCPGAPRLFFFLKWTPLRPPAAVFRIERLRVRGCDFSGLFLSSPVPVCTPCTWGKVFSSCCLCSLSPPRFDFSRHSFFPAAFWTGQSVHSCKVPCRGGCQLPCGTLINKVPPPPFRNPSVLFNFLVNLLGSQFYPRLWLLFSPSFQAFRTSSALVTHTPPPGVGFCRPFGRVILCFPFLPDNFSWATGTSLREAISTGQCDRHNRFGLVWGGFGLGCGGWGWRCVFFLVFSLGGSSVLLDVSGFFITLLRFS